LAAPLQADVFLAMNDSLVTLLSLHDISVAFNTVGHTILLDGLSKSVGIAVSSQVPIILYGLLCLLNKIKVINNFVVVVVVVAIIGVGNIVRFLPTRHTWIP